MENSKRKTIMRKFIAIFMFIILLFNLVMPTYSKAEFDWGGTLWTPIQELVCGLGDVIFNLLQKSFIEGAPDAVYKATMSQFKEGKSYGWFEDKIIGIGDFFTGNDGGHDYRRKQIVFPSIYYSVENIFGNKIPAFDVNFINPNVDNPTVDVNGEDVKKRTEDLEYVNDIASKVTQDLSTGEIIDEDIKALNEKINSKIAEIESKYSGRNDNELSEQEKAEKNWAQMAKDTLNNLSFDPINIDSSWQVQMPQQTVDASEDYTKIVSSAYDANINLGTINPESVDTNTDTSSSTAIGHIASDLQPTIAKWYNAFRNLALVAMLSILVYTGIRITLGSTSQEQAKYKIMLKDWVVAVCILFIMHYIMSFALTITEAISDMLYNSYTTAMDGQAFVEDDENAQNGNSNTQNADDQEDINGYEGLTGSNANTIASLVRVRVSIASDTGEAMGYTIMYAVFVVYTIIFTWQYLKRVVYMAFLTMIAPLVAMTYPIDKMRDGSAQGFDMWLKEYVFNLLLQPLHLLLFTILVVSALDLAQTSVIYSLIALGFLLEAVKIIKSFFGFDKAPISGGGFASGFAGGALFSAGLGALKRLPGIGRRGGKPSGGKSSGGDSKINFSAGSERGSKFKSLASFNDGNSTSSLSTGKTATDGAKDGSKKAKAKNKSKFAGILSGISGKNSTGNAGSKSIGNQNLFATAEAARARSKNLRNMNGKHRKITGIAKGIGAVGWKGVKKFVPAAAKYSVAGLGAATLGTIGIAAGLASDNIEDVAKYGLAGVAGGFAVGKTAASSVGNLASNVKGGAGGIKDTFQQGYYGEEYEAEKANAEWKKSKEVDDHLKSLYGAEWKIAKEGQLYMRKEAGITDQKDLDIATNLLRNHPEITMDQAADIMQFRKKKDMGELRDPSKRIGIENKVGKLVPDQDKRDKVMSLLDEVLDV